MANMNCATLDSDVGIHISNFSGCDCLACVPENNESAQTSLVDLEEIELSKHSLPLCPLSQLWIWMGHSNTCCLSVLEHSCFFLGAAGCIVDMEGIPRHMLALVFIGPIPSQRK